MKIEHWMATKNQVMRQWFCLKTLQCKRSLNICINMLPHDVNYRDSIVSKQGRDWEDPAVGCDPLLCTAEISLWISVTHSTSHLIRIACLVGWLTRNHLQCPLVFRSSTLEVRKPLSQLLLQLEMATHSIAGRGVTSMFHEDFWDSISFLTTGTVSVSLHSSHHEQGKP